MTKSFAIFASGTGSNAYALMKSAQNSEHCQISFVLTDQRNAGVIEKAKSFSIAVEVCPIEKEKFANFQEAKLEQEKKIILLLEKYEVDYVLLAGYMRILSKEFVQTLYPRIINIHPSYLPDFPGRDGYQDAYNAKVPESGITIHFVDSQVDSGPIIIQKKFPRKESDTLEDFKKRGLELEHKLYPQVMEWLAGDRIVLNTDNGQVDIRK